MHTSVTSVLWVLLDGHNGRLSSLLRFQPYRKGCSLGPCGIVSLVLRLALRRVCSPPSVYTQGCKMGTGATVLRFSPLCNCYPSFVSCDGKWAMPSFLGGSSSAGKLEGATRADRIHDPTCVKVKQTRCCGWRLLLYSVTWGASAGDHIATRAQPQFLRICFGVATCRAWMKLSTSEGFQFRWLWQSSASCNIQLS